MRSSRTNFGARGVAALEEEEVALDEAGLTRPETVPPVGEGEELAPPLEDNANSLETDLIEVADGEADVEDAGDQIDEGLDTVEALEALRIVVKDAAKNGGLDRTGAKISRLHLEHLYTRVGSKSAKKPTPAIEQFGGASDRVRTTLALEADIKGNITSLLQTIKSAIQKAIEFIVGLFNKIFDGATKAGERAKSLGERAKEAAGAPSAKEIDNGRLASELVMGKVVPADGSGGERVLEVLRSLYQGLPSDLEVLEEIGAAAGESKADGIMGLVNSKPTGKDLGLDVVSNPGELGLKDIGEGAHVSRSKELPGRKTLLVIVVPTAFEKSTATIADFYPGQPEPEGLKVPVLDQTGAERQTKTVEEIASTVIGGKQLLAKCNDAKKKLISYVDKLAASAGKEDSGDLQASSRALRGVLKLIDAPFVSINSYAVRASKSLLDQVEESLKQYGGEAAAPAAAA